LRPCPRVWQRMPHVGRVECRLLPRAEHQAKPVRRVHREPSSGSAPTWSRTGIR
jgi:hypothetical protein